jgi:hypothetical protein
MNSVYVVSVCVGWGGGGVRESEMNLFPSTATAESTGYDTGGHNTFCELFFTITNTISAQQM